MSSGSSIPQALVDSLRTRLRGQTVGTALELAVRAATEPDRERRAWALVALAVRLRREHAPAELARMAIDGAVALDAGAEPTRAAQTFAVALHADEGDLAEAVKVGERLLAEGQDVHVLKTMARVYWGLWKQTKDEAWHDRWWRVHVRLHDTAPISS
jgi:hypothetical protein